MRQILLRFISALFRIETFVFLLVVTILLVYTFSLREITVDKYTIILLGILLFLATLSYVRMIKIPYVFEFHKAIRGAVKKIKKSKKPPSRK